MENSAVNPSVSAINAAPEKWRTLLNQFENVLALNIFIADPQGHVLLSLSPSGQNGDYGSIFLTTTFGFEPDKDRKIALAGFESVDGHLRIIDPFELYVFAVPVIVREDNIDFYLIAGPIAVNKSWPDDKYLALAKQLGLADGDFLKNIHCVPRMSVPAVNATLDLLAEVVRDVLILETEKQKLHSMQSSSEVVRPEIIDAAKDIFVSIQQDELLIAILDNAIKMTSAQGGSILLFDEQSQEFVMRVSRGLENKKNIMQARVKIGEGIVGLAAKGKTPLFIKGTESQASLQPFLKRPEIKHSIIMPLVVNEKVIGVLNLCTKNDINTYELDRSADDVRQLSRFLATALQSF